MVGFVGGIVSSFGFEYLSPFLERTMGLQDTAGVHNLHGMPGVLGGLMGCLAISVLSDEKFFLYVGEYFSVKTERSTND